MQEIDPHAFVVIHEVKEVLGQGFTFKRSLTRFDSEEMNGIEK
ncbi:DUF2179 domain-containing protein [Paenibacillus beijingensis]